MKGHHLFLQLEPCVKEANNGMQTLPRYWERNSLGISMHHTYTPNALYCHKARQ